MTYTQCDYVVEEIRAERSRQVEKEGYVPALDRSMYRDGELAHGAAAYAISNTIYGRNLWPDTWSPMKPKDRRRDLVRAAALLVAEIERMDAVSQLKNSR